MSFLGSVLVCNNSGAYNELKAVNLLTYTGSQEGISPQEEKEKQISLPAVSDPSATGGSWVFVNPCLLGCLANLRDKPAS